MSCSIKVKELTKTYENQPGSSLSDVVASILSIPRNSEEISLRPALDKVSFEIAQGERIGIIGENGAGKSTLVSHIAGVLTPSSGSLEIEGKVVASLSMGLYERDELTGRENLGLNLAELTGTSANSTIDDLINFVDLGDYIDQPMRTYSTGMRARISFAKLVFSEPEILVIDETLSVGDRKFNEKAAKAMRNLCDKGKIVILVSHGLDAILELCDRCIWLREGRIELDAHPREVVPAYREFVRLKEEKHQMAEDSFSDKRQSDRIYFDKLTLFADSHEMPRRIFLDTDDLNLKIEIVSERHLADLGILVSIESLDGLRLIEAQPDWKGLPRVLGAGRHQFVVKFGKACFQAGYYSVQCEIHDKGEVVGRQVTTFKTEASVGRKGGSPILTLNPVVKRRVADSKF